MLLASEVGVSPLRVSVTNVVEIRAQKEVIWIYAQSIVAAMEDARPVMPISWRQRAVGQFPGDSMSLRSPAIDLRYAVPKWSGCRTPASPLPAWAKFRADYWARFINALPKPFSY